MLIVLLPLIILLVLVSATFLSDGDFKVYVEEDRKLIEVDGISGNLQYAETSHCCAPIKAEIIDRVYLDAYCYCSKLNDFICTEYLCNEFIVK